ncbi:DUF4442 domain-containing protein, partial [Pseudomonas aeruginosa]|uniref:DUF4442 domain-containing protein n=1 Tax=Pseudomonas aeruginosa TaxID=287 RepID=UPI003F3B049F
MSAARRLARRARMLRWLLNFYPPYLGAGIHIQEISPDMRSVKVRMKLTRWNRNYVGTQFGGSLYAMVDPFYMLLLIEQLGRDYIVWDKAASIDFITPGKGPVYAEFHVDDALLDEIRQQTASGKRYLPRLQVEIRDGA